MSGGLIFAPIFNGAFANTSIGISHWVFIVSIISVLISGIRNNHYLQLDNCPHICCCYCFDNNNKDEDHGLNANNINKLDTFIFLRK